VSIETNFQNLNNKYNQSDLLSMRMPGYLTQFFDSIIYYFKVFETIM